MKEFNKNVVKNTRHNECVDVCFNKKLIRYKIKRIYVIYIELELMMSVKFVTATGLEPRTT